MTLKYQSITIKLNFKNRVLKKTLLHSVHTQKMYQNLKSLRFHPRPFPSVFLTNFVPYTLFCVCVKIVGINGMK